MYKHELSVKNEENEITTGTLVTDLPADELIDSLVKIDAKDENGNPVKVVGFCDEVFTTEEM